MRLIRQRNVFDCGHAVAAMACGVPYVRAQRADPDPNAMHGLWVAEMRAMLAALSGREWMVRKPVYSALAKTRLAKLGPVVLVRAPGHRLGHWVAWDGHKIRDPQLGGTYLPAKYPRRRWLVIRWLLPAPTLGLSALPLGALAAPTLGALAAFATALPSTSTSTSTSTTLKSERVHGSAP